MNILLINSNRLKHPWPVIPFGMCSVAAALEAAGHEVVFLDLCFSKDPDRDVRLALSNIKAELVGVGIRNIDNASGYNTVFLLDQIKAEVIDPLKSAFEGPIVIGGSAVGISGAEILNFFDLPLAIQGDGERAIVELSARLEEKLPLNGLGGLIRRQNGVIIEENPPLPVTDLNAMPLIKFDRYLEIRRYRKYNSPLQIQTKRGCALRCVYCTYNRLEGRVYRLKDPLLVANEVETLVKETGIRHIEFTDSTFNIPLGHAKAVLRAVAAKGLKLRCRALGLNPSAVDEELVKLMQRVGFQDVDLGAESGCNQTLLGLGKNFRQEDVLKAGKLLNQANIPTTWYLLLGAPGETEDTLHETLETIGKAASPWDLVVIGIGIRVYKGAPVTKTLQASIREGISDNFLRPVFFEPEAIDMETIKAITKRAYHRYPNFLMYSENSQYPEVILKATSIILKWFFPRQPMWRVYIFVRKILKALGVD
ncbi:B12-binding domain-containing radical SAM protein [Thermodesulfobacteriota bacterium]